MTVCVMLSLHFFQESFKIRAETYGNAEVTVLEYKALLKIVLYTVLGSLLVGCSMLAVLPVLTKYLAVEVVYTEPPVVTTAPLPEKPQEVLVTVYYEMEEDSKKIASIQIEVFHIGSSTVSYFEVPADTKINLSEDLYKSLQTYAPELPQYLKLSNMAESFSAEYGLTGCNRILSEVLGVSLTEYVRADAETMAAWLELQGTEKTETEYFAAYADWIKNSTSSLTVEERWTYYESRRKVEQVEQEVAPGSQEKDGYLISGKRSKERLGELILLRKVTTEQE